MNTSLLAKHWNKKKNLSKMLMLINFVLINSAISWPKKKFSEFGRLWLMCIANQSVMWMTHIQPIRYQISLTSLDTPTNFVRKSVNLNRVRLSHISHKHSHVSVIIFILVYISLVAQWFIYCCFILTLSSFVPELCCELLKLMICEARFRTKPLDLHVHLLIFSLFTY